jgi:hypothetical protein
LTGLIPSELGLLNGLNVLDVGMFCFPFLCCMIVLIRQDPPPPVAFLTSVLHSPLLPSPGQNFFQGTLPTQVGDIRSLYQINLGTFVCFWFGPITFFVLFEPCSLLAFS